MAAVTRSTRSTLDDRRHTRQTRMPRTRLLSNLCRAAAFAIALAGIAGAAGALDDLIPGRVAAAEGDACPALTQIKYPFISCEANEYGGTTLRLPGQPAPLVCHLRLADGSCGASPQEWQLDMPLIGPPPE